MGQLENGNLETEKKHSNGFLAEWVGLKVSPLALNA